MILGFFGREVYRQAPPIPDWFTRSAEFRQQPLQTLRWLRIFGDTVFLTGTAALAYFMPGLWTGWSYEREPAPVLDGETVTISGAVAS